MRTVVVTVARGRHDHLRRQLQGLGRSTRRPFRHVVVALDDAEIDEVVESAEVATRVVHVRSEGAALPLALARNTGAREAIIDGADLLVFLDVDCIPGRRLVERYVHAARVLPHALLSGPVAHLDPPRSGCSYDLDEIETAPGHPDRPVPPEDAIVPGADHRLFWSLSFAVTSATWVELGGFCERYDGYGAEDTDFGQVARAKGIDHAGSGARGRTTSTTRSPTLPPSTSPRSSATPVCSTNGGAGGR